MSSINLRYPIHKVFQWSKTYGSSLKRKSFRKLHTMLLKLKLIFDIIQYEETERDLFPSNVIIESSFERVFSKYFITHSKVFRREKKSREKIIKFQVTIVKVHSINVLEKISPGKQESILSSLCRVRDLRTFRPSLNTGSDMKFCREIPVA